MVIVLFMMQLSKKVPFDDPNTLMAVRALYVLSNFIIAGIYAYCQWKINKKRGVCMSLLPGRTNISDLTVLKYVEPAQMGSQEEPKLVTTTVQAYDLAQIRSAYKGQAMGIAMMGFMHLYLRYTNPLLIQSIIPLKGALENNMTKLYIWNTPATGDLKRPFKAAGGIMAAMGGQTGEVKTDKASIEAAERSGRGGVKEE